MLRRALLLGRLNAIPGVNQNPRAQSDEAIDGQIVFCVVRAPRAYLERHCACRRIDVVHCGQQREARFVMMPALLGFGVRVFAEERPIELFTCVVVAPPHSRQPLRESPGDKRLPSHHSQSACGLGAHEQRPCEQANGNRLAPTLRHPEKEATDACAATWLFPVQSLRRSTRSVPCYAPAGHLAPSPMKLKARICRCGS